MMMVRHVVIWKFKEEAEGASKAENLKIAEKMLLALKDQILEIKSIDVITNAPAAKSGNFDMMLDTTFVSWDALNAYVVHPEHQKAGSFIKSVVEDRACVDAEVEAE